MHWCQTQKYSTACQTSVTLQAPQCVLVLDRAPQIWQLPDPFIHICPTIPPRRFAQRSKSDYSEQIRIWLLKKHHRYQIATKRQKSSWENYQPTTLLLVWALGLFIIPHFKCHILSFKAVILSNIISSHLCHCLGGFRVLNYVALRLGIVPIFFSLEFWAFLDPSSQTQLYHTPLLSKIWDLNNRKKIGEQSL